MLLVHRNTAAVPQQQLMSIVGEGALNDGRNSWISLMPEMVGDICCTIQQCFTGGHETGVGEKVSNR